MNTGIAHPILPGAVVEYKCTPCLILRLNFILILKASAWFGALFCKSEKDLFLHRHSMQSSRSTILLLVVLHGHI